MSYFKKLKIMPNTGELGVCIYSNKNIKYNILNHANYQEDIFSCWLNSYDDEMEVHTPNIFGQYTFTRMITIAYDPFKYIKKCIIESYNTGKSIKVFGLMCRHKNSNIIYNKKRGYKL